MLPFLNIEDKSGVGVTVFTNHITKIEQKNTGCIIYLVDGSTVETKYQWQNLSVHMQINKKQ